MWLLQTVLFFSAIHRGQENQPAKKARGDGGGDSGSGGRDQHAYNCLLQNELLGARIEEVRGPSATCADGNKASLGAAQTPKSSPAYLPVYRFNAHSQNAVVSCSRFFMHRRMYSVTDCNCLFLSYNPNFNRCEIPYCHISLESILIL